MDAHVHDARPQLSIEILGARQDAQLNGVPVALAPSIHAMVPVPGRDWTEYAGYALNSDNLASVGGGFMAWCTQPEYEDVARFSLSLIRRTGDLFTIECNAAVTLHDLGDQPCTVQIYALSSVPFNGIGVGIPLGSADPAGDARRLASRFLDLSHTRSPTVTERRGRPEGPVLTFEVWFSPEANGG